MESSDASKKPVLSRGLRLGVSTAESPSMPRRHATARHQRSRWAGEALLGMGRSQRGLAIALIVVLSSGLALLFYGQLRESAALSGMFRDANGLLRGFALLMLLTVVYLVSKHWSTSRDQLVMIEQLLEEEAIARALQQNPITDFHHPDVCRDILVQQASHAARLHAPLAVLELNFSKLGALSSKAEGQVLVGELIRALRGLCRATDSVLRWTPDSFLLAFPEVTSEELSAISERLRLELEQWLAGHFDEAMRPALQVRGAASNSLESGGDILLEVQRLLERETRASQTDSRAGRREKGIALALELEVRGENLSGNSFEEKVATERVAADRFWCGLKNQPMEFSPLIVAAADGSFTAEAVLTRWAERDGERIAEIRFTGVPPERWPIRSEA